MKISELLRLVFLNLTQNKFKVIMTSIGIVVGAATIFMVIAIGVGGQEDVAEQFKNLNAGAIDISYESSAMSASGNSSSSEATGGFEMGGMPSGGGGAMQVPSGNESSGNESSNTEGSDTGRQWNNDSTSGFSMNGGGMSGVPGMDSFFGGSDSSSGSDSRINQENVSLTIDDMEDLETFVPDISAVSISNTTKSTVDGGDLEEETTYTIAGVLSNYSEISNLTMAIGDFITEANEENSEKVCILGSSVAKEIFGSVDAAYDEIIYIDGRPYVVNGVIDSVGEVASGISPDEAIFIPYSTETKYLSGTDTSPTITVIASDVDDVDEVMANIETVLAETYPNTEFTLSDAGSKMEAASESNNILTMLLVAMATIVFVVGGIGIMNVLMLSVKERTKEIGILKSMGCSKKDILLEFLLEACFISIIGGVIGVTVGFLIKPIVESFGVSVVPSAFGGILAVVFASLTGTIFGFFPAFKASNLVPVEALSEE